MKEAIRIKTERDRELVIPYFEKHYPNCNGLMVWKTKYLYIGDIVWVDSDNDLRNYNFRIPSDYTIFNGVPENFELPKTTNDNPILGYKTSLVSQQLGEFESKTREQQLEEDNKALRETLEMAKQYFSDGTTDDLIILCERIDKQLLSQTTNK